MYAEEYERVIPPWGVDLREICKGAIYSSMADISPPKNLTSYSIKTLNESNINFDLFQIENKQLLSKLIPSKLHEENNPMYVMILFKILESL